MTPVIAQLLIMAGFGALTVAAFAGDSRLGGARPLRWLIRTGSDMDVAGVTVGGTGVLFVCVGALGAAWYPPALTWLSALVFLWVARTCEARKGYRLLLRQERDASVFFEQTLLALLKVGPPHADTHAAYEAVRKVSSQLANVRSSA